MTSRTPKDVDIFMQGKGGAGCTYAAAILCEYCQRRDIPYQAHDLDTLNASLADIKALNVKRLIPKAERSDAYINDRIFAQLIQRIIKGNDRRTILDVGTGSFLLVQHYLRRGEGLQRLHDHGIKTTIHCVIRGGGSLYGCLNNLRLLITSHTPVARLVVWLNEVDGPLTYNGKSFERLKIYRDLCERIEQIVTLRTVKSDLVKADIAAMTTRHRTTEEAIRASDTGICNKLRYRQIQREYDALIRQVI